MVPETSVIIRTKDERKIFKKVLEKLKNQTYQDFEVVQVDDNSKDGTQNLVFKYFPRERIKLIKVPKGKFSHPYSSNLGAKASSGKYLVLINGHAIPISDSWLEDGLKNFARFSQVAGVYGIWRALPNSSFWDKLIINIFFSLEFFLKRKKQIIRTSFHPGLLQTTNAIILKELWQKEYFDETRGMGGEDTAWGMYWINKGYKIILDKKFTVFHSHNLSLKGWVREFQFWNSLVNPQPFNPLTYKKYGD